MARAAHEVNNALNGAAMNLEVVRLRAVPGKDAGAVASFAAAALVEQEAVAAGVAALVALGRAPRPGAPVDVREVLGHVAALLGPVIRHSGVSLEVAASSAAPTGAPTLAVRLAVCSVLELAGAAASGPASGGAGDRSGTLRCTLLSGPSPTFVVEPAPPVWPDDTPDVLAAHGIRATADGVALRVVFPAP